MDTFGTYGKIIDGSLAVTASKIDSVYKDVLKVGL